DSATAMMVKYQAARRVRNDRVLITALWGLSSSFGFSNGVADAPFHERIQRVVVDPHTASVRFMHDHRPAVASWIEHVVGRTGVHRIPTADETRQFLIILNHQSP